MANISISEIYGNTQSQRIQNDDLFLMSLHNNSNDTYTTASINGLKLKCNMVLPSAEYLNRFRHTIAETNTLNHGTLQNGDFVEYFQLTLPVDSFVHVWGEFTLDSYETYRDIHSTGQWLSMKIPRNDGSLDFLTLNPQVANYLNSDGVPVDRSVSFWSGYAKANTTFVLIAQFQSEASKNKFVNGLNTSYSYFKMSHFDPNNN